MSHRALAGSFRQDVGMLDVALVDPVTYHQDVLPGLLAGTRCTMAAVGLDGIAPLTLVVGEHSWTYRIVEGRVAVEPGPTAGVSGVVLSAAAWSDFAQFIRSAPALAIGGELTFTGDGGFNLLAKWEPALRAVYVGIPAGVPQPGLRPDRRDRGRPPTAPPHRPAAP